MDHTKEPWRVPDEKPTSIVDAENQEIMCNIREANARRIVACVNKCVGIETEDLENGATFSEQFYAIRNQREISDAELSPLRAAISEKTREIDAWRRAAKTTGDLLAEKTAQVDRLRETLIEFRDLTAHHVQWTARGKELKSISDRLEKIDEAIAATAPSEEKSKT